MECRWIYEMMRCYFLQLFLSSILLCVMQPMHSDSPAVSDASFSATPCSLLPSGLIVSDAMLWCVPTQNYANLTYGRASMMRWRMIIGWASREEKGCSRWRSDVGVIAKEPISFTLIHLSNQISGQNTTNKPTHLSLLWQVMQLRGVVLFCVMSVACRRGPHVNKKVMSSSLVVNSWLIWNFLTSYVHIVALQD